MAKTYFISYTGQDKEWANWIAAVLEEQGQTVLNPEWDIRAGDNFVSKMNEFIRKCDVCIPVLSQAYLESAYCTAEWTNIFAVVVKEKEKRMIPVRVSDVNPDGLFYATVYVDLYDEILAHDEKAAEKKLIEGVISDEASRDKPGFPTATATPPTAQTATPHTTPRASFPGALPLNNLQERNPHFTGREEQLGAIRLQFRSGGAGCVKQTITGLGGIGKTQTAIEYAWRSIHDYKDTVWFVNAETELSAFSDCLGFAKAAGVAPEQPDGAGEPTPDKLASLLKAWFAAHNSWLFIFDNVERREVISPYLSNVQTGHILFTTRERELKQGKLVGVESFTHAEAARFMRDRLYDCIELVDDEAALVQLVMRMNNFPLALEQAAAYMARANRSCSDYIALLEKHGALKTLSAKMSRPSNYLLAVNETLSLSYEKLSGSARQLLNLCAYMYPDGIPLALFTRQIESLPMPLKEGLSDDFSQDEIIMELLNYSLVKRDGDYLSMHRFLQEVCREQACNDGTDWPNLCIDAIISDLPKESDYGSRANRDKFERIAAHASSAAGHICVERRDDADIREKAAWAYYLLGYGGTELTWYWQALEWYKQALELEIEIYGEQQQITARTLNDIGVVYSHTGEYEESLAWLTRAMSIREAVLGDEHPEYANSCNNIAYAYSSQGDYELALAWYNKTVGIQEKAPGPDDPALAKTYNNIGFTHSGRGEYPEALKCYLKALKIYANSSYRYRVEGSNVMINIGEVCEHLRDFTEALSWYLKALGIREDVLGSDHPKTVYTYISIAEVHHALRDYSSALEWLHKALAARERVLGSEHPETMLVREYIERVISFNVLQ